MDNHHGVRYSADLKKLEDVPTNEANHVRPERFRRTPEKFNDSPGCRINLEESDMNRRIVCSANTEPLEILTSRAMS